MNDFTEKLYAEHTENPDTWKSPRPMFNAERFQQELTKRCGYIGNNPRFRLVWGGDSEMYLIEEYDMLTGFHWRKDGQDMFTPVGSEQDVPDDKIAVPVYERMKYFQPRWQIEEFRGDFYHATWTVERLELQADDTTPLKTYISHYREPSETDIQLMQGIARKRDTLTHSEIVEGVARMKQAEIERQAYFKREMAGEANDEEAKMMTDGVTVPVYSFAAPKIKENKNGLILR